MNKLKAWLQTHDLTRENLSFMTGVKLATINKIVDGKVKDVKYSTALKIYKVTELWPSDYIEGLQYLAKLKLKTKKLSTTVKRLA